MKALEIARRRSGDRSPLAAGLMVDLAAAARMQRRTADAKQLLTDALTIYRAADKAPNAAVGVCLHRLGQIALDEKQPATAIRLFQQVVAIDESIYGSGHVEVADDLVMLAAAHAAMGQADLAEEIRARARAIEERAASNEEEADDAAP